MFIDGTAKDNVTSLINYQKECVNFLTENKLASKDITKSEFNAAFALTDPSKISK